MTILVRKDDSGYVNPADKNLTLSFIVKDFKESFEIMKKIEKKITDNIKLENNYTNEEAKTYIEITTNNLEVEEETEWLTTTVKHGDDYWYIIRLKEEKYKKNSLDDFL